MKSSIYISSKEIQVISFKKNTTDENLVINTLPLSEGTMINGKIFDAGEIIEKLKELQLKDATLFENVELIIDGNFITTKKLNVPKLKPEQYYSLVKDEFAQGSDGRDDIIYDYKLLSNSKALAYAIEKNVYQSYLQIFEQIHVKLKAIRIGLDLIISNIIQHPELSKKAMICNIVEGNILFSILVNNGDYVLSRRTRLLDENAEQKVSAILENLSSMVQFAKAQNIDNLDSSLYVGLPATTHKEIIDRSTVDVKIGIIDGFATSKYTTTYLYPMLNVLYKKITVNLIASEKNISKYITHKRHVNLLYVFVGVVIVGLLGFSAYLKINTWLVQRQIDEIYAYIQSEEISQKIERIDKVVNDNNRMSHILNQFDQKTEELKTMKHINTKLLDLINNTHSSIITIESYRFTQIENKISVSASCSNEDDAANYSDAIKANENIESVVYTGYGYELDRFKFTIDVVIK